jgi:endonuclease YncB( thermonuclease family)
MFPSAISTPRASGFFRRRAFVLSALLLLTAFTGDVLTGKVVKVQDGDTITLWTKENVQIKIRLYGIDAPEKDQDYGQKAKERLSELVAARAVRVEQKGKDQYGRVVGIVYVKDVNVNEEMLKSGLAWRYKYNKNRRYLQLQEEAQKAKLNIWSKKNPIDPWLWRKEKMSSKKKK